VLRLVDNLVLTVMDEEAAHSAGMRPKKEYPIIGTSVHWTVDDRGQRKQHDQLVVINEDGRMRNLYPSKVRVAFAAWPQDAREYGGEGIAPDSVEGNAPAEMEEGSM
jgi:hypothetical protein